VIKNDGYDGTTSPFRIGLFISDSDRKYMVENKPRKLQMYNDDINTVMEDLVDNWESEYRDSVIALVEQKMEKYISDQERE